MYYQRLTGGTQQVCAQQCSKDERCGAWTYHVGHQRCELRHECGRLQDDNDQVTGIKDDDFWDRQNGEYEYKYKDPYPVHTPSSSEFMLRVHQKSY
eukprot:scaffold436585_cov47-Prasinocladus_malaysianus.AAC.1